MFGSYLVRKKAKVESFLQEVDLGLDYAMNDPEAWILTLSATLNLTLALDLNAKVSLEDKVKFLHATRHSLGYTGLLLSGGGSLAMHHMGVVKVDPVIRVYGCAHDRGRCTPWASFASPADSEPPEPAPAGPDPE